MFSLRGLKSRIRNVIYYAVRDAIRDEVRTIAYEAALQAVNDPVTHMWNNRDIDLQQQLNARASSADYAEKHFADAKRFTDQFDLLSYALSHAPENGLICEFGVYKGNTANFMADKVPDRIVHGFDSFEGLPEKWRPHLEAGFFSLDSQLPEVRPNVKLYPGWFSDSLPPFMRDHSGPAALLHVDCDLYSSTKCVFESFRDRIVPGTVISFDEYWNYSGWPDHEYKAFQELVADHGFRYKYLAYNARDLQVTVQIV